MRSLAFAVIAILAGSCLVTVLPLHAGAAASAVGSQQPPTAGDGLQPELGLPATSVVAIGSAPSEEHETWAYGRLGLAPVNVDGSTYANQYALLEHGNASSWQVVPLPSLKAGEPLVPDTGAATPAEYGAAAGQVTGAGGVVLLAGQNVVLRDPIPPGDPGSETKLAPAPPAESSAGGASKTGKASTGAPPGQSPPGGAVASGVLGADESLLPAHPSGGVTIPYAAIEDDAGPAGAHTGVLIAPYHDGRTAGIPPGVLDYDGENWSREKIDLEDGKEGQEPQGFVALALSCGATASSPNASSPENCWLLASAELEGKTKLLLYRRVSNEGGYEWVRAQGEGLPDEESDVGALPQGAQMLTATAQGVWVDFQRQLPLEIQDVSEMVVPSGSGVRVLGSWCYPTGSGCESTLGAKLPPVYRSFAWAGNGEDPGTRIVTGLREHAMLELSGGAFTYQVGVGGATGAAPGGAAFEPPQPGQPVTGWIADGINGDSAPDGAGQAQAIELTPTPAADQLGEESVPFRRPLYALAQPPGATPENPEAPVIAVGELGQIGRYVPGSGWRAESLYNSAGTVQRPTLRAVAWPENGRIYAVGDSGAMWLWRAETGLWEPDPSKPLNFIGNLQAIAFQPGDPQLGYAVGRQGALLKFGKSWEQVPLPAELREVSFTSITFAGGEALATYRTTALPAGESSDDERYETGGIAVEEVGDGRHWHVDPGAAALLGELPETNRVLSKVSGLPDGGVVAAGPGKVLERESPSSPWRFSTDPLPEVQNIAALAAYRDSSGALRALVSADLDEKVNPENFNDLESTPFEIDLPPPTGVNQAPIFLGPDVLPNSGYLLQETASGWIDMEHDTLPANDGAEVADMPRRPDPVLAMLVSQNGGAGIAVGGQTGNLEGGGLNASHEKNIHYQTATVQRFPVAMASTDGATAVPLTTTVSGRASFAVGGQAACAQLCSNQAAEGLGPDAWLEHALQASKRVAAESPGGLRGFLYVGGRLPAGAAQKAVTERKQEGLEEFERELGRFGQLLGSAGALPVYLDKSEDMALSGADTEPFTKLLAPFLPNVKGGGYYETTTQHGVSGGDSGGAVEVLALSFREGALEAGEEGWLIEELASARSNHIPVVVMGSDSLGFALPDERSSSAGQKVALASSATAASISSILVEGEASAYFFDYPGSNVQTQVSSQGREIPAFGTGTLGYVKPAPEGIADSLGSSGFLIVEVETSARVSGAANVAPVSAHVVPNIGQLALGATDGTFLRRSHVALFEALARRPGGGVAVGVGETGTELSGPDLYDEVPFNCFGGNCPNEVPEEYTFTSSRPDIGNFVAHEPASASPREVLLGANQLPVPDSHSGLFCAFNAGTTTVSITTGGLTYSEPVTVQAGSVEYPCGTVPLKNPPALEAPVSQNFNLPELAPSANPPTTKPQVQAIAPPSAPPVAPAVVHPKPQRHAKAAPLASFLPALAGLALLRPAILPPPPTTPRPSPPTGTSSAQVTEGAVAPEREREEEHAIDMVHNMAAYSQEETRPLPYYLPVVILLLAFSSAGLYDARRRRRPELAGNGENSVSDPLI